MQVGPQRAPLRRDAERNRERIVAHARRLVAEAGLGVSHDDVARAAEVGVGTVYRRFPSRGDLLEELFRDRITSLVALAEQASAQESAWDGLRAFLGQVVEQQVHDRGMRELLGASPHAPALARHAREQIAPVVAGLLHRAQDEGSVRPEVAVTDIALVPLLTSAVAVGGDLAVAQRVLALLLDGLRPGPAPLPGRPASPAQLEQLLSGAAPLPSTRHQEKS